jgi:hypothetical protein
MADPPGEANLPTDVRTGRFLESGEPWVPMIAPTLSSLRDSSGRTAVRR